MAKAKAAKATKAPGHKAIVADAARRWHVPFWILWGVFGMETDFGAAGGHAVSSAGAQGWFQFMPATAHQYNVNPSDFASSANGAAHLLHDLHKSSGSWDAALRGYSGGGYGKREVKAKARSGGVSPATSDRVQTSVLAGGAGQGATATPAADLFGIPIPNPMNPLDPLGLGGGGGGVLGAGDALGSFVDVAKASLAFLKFITDVQSWIRIGEVIAGLILIHDGLKNLGGGSVPLVDSAVKAGKTAAKDATIAAVVK